MQVDNAIDTISKFFNELISTCVPSLVLVISLIVMHLGPIHLLSLARLEGGVGLGLIMVGLLFALGHILLAVNQKVMKPVLTRFKLLKKFDEEKAKNRQSYQWFAEIASDRQGTVRTVWDFHDLRSVALSVSVEAALIGRRFMFISLLCSGVGTALVIVGIDYSACIFLTPQLIYSYTYALPIYIQSVLIFGTAFLLFKQSDDFFSRAMTAPFSIAVAEMKVKKNAG
ncbi:hypothetical protein [Shewanella sp.]|uniref:hypothetical protein n=1 Tax=Shewanella sp. TaxID=50422 RepID=UPI003D12FCB1